MLTMKTIIISIIGSMIIGYGFGCINISYIISRLHGFDIRKYGSGNAGASNVIIVMGKKIGFFAAIFDILKAFFAVVIARWCFEDAIVSNINYAGFVAGAFSIVGHIAPFYMKFKGGKGLASLGGTILATDVKLFAVLLLCAVVIAIATDYICFVPVSIVVAFPVICSYTSKTLWPLVIFIIPILMVWYRHIENFKRIQSGAELRFHFLWNRQSEAERLGVVDDGKAIFENEVDKDNYNINHGLKS